MNELLLINTEIGKIPVIIKEQETIDGISFIGEFFDNNLISVTSTDKKDCLKILEIYINSYIDSWLENELSGLNISYGKK